MPFWARHVVVGAARWSEPLTITSEQDIDNRAVAFNDAGAVLAYFRRYGAASDDADQMSELDDGTWGTPQRANDLNWPLAESKRTHVHRVLDAHDLPVKHATRRTGSPYTLVLTKTSAVFERDAAERAAWQRALNTLKGKLSPPARRGAPRRRADSKRVGDGTGLRTE